MGMTSLRRSLRMLARIEPAVFGDDTSGDTEKNMSKKLYKLTEKHRAQLKPWADKWIANAMSTKPMDDEEREICRTAVRELYVAAGKAPPPNHRIVFVPSPFVLRFAGGFAAAIWWLRKNKKAGWDDSATRSATRSATDSATESATRSATRLATYSATESATDSAARLATDSAARSATYLATHSAARSALGNGLIDKKSWFQFPVDAMVGLSVELWVGRFGLMCAQSAHSMWQGGNQWSAWDSFLTFFRHVVKLEIDYSKYDHWEQLSLHGGPRIVHDEFCMISDRPRVLKVNERNQPHCSDGPFCKWSDGSALYALNGVHVPAWVVETPANEITKKMIFDEKNVDVRREIIRRIGKERLLEVLDYSVLDKMDDYKLITFDIGDGRVRPFLLMVNPSIGVQHVEGVSPEIITVKAALAWRNGLKNYVAPGVIT